MKCKHCGSTLGKGLVYFCSNCWWKLPAPERSALHLMYVRGLNVDSKVAKCVRILTEQKQTSAAIPEQTEGKIK